MKEKKSLPFVHVIVLNYDGKHLLANTLPLLQKLNYPKNKHKIIVVDNGSTDGSEDFIRKNFPAIEVLRIEKNYGYGSGYNAGISHVMKDSISQYIFILGNDVFVDKDCIAESVKVMEADEAIAIAQSKSLKFDNPKILDSVGCKLTLTGGCIFDHQITKQESADSYSEVKDVMADLVAALIRVDALRKVGLFDEKFFLCFEDLDLCWRLWLRKYRTVLSPKSIVYHKRYSTTKRKYKTYYLNYLFRKNIIAAMIKNYGALNLIKYLPLRIFYFIFESLRYLPTDIKKSEGFLSAILWNLKEIKYLLGERANIQRNREVDDKYIIDRVFVKKL